MRNKKVIASFKCVLAMLSCLMLGACKPQMAKSAMKAAGKVFSKSGSKAERFAERVARSGGVHMPHMSGDDVGRAVNAGARPIPQQGWGDASKAAAAGAATAYHLSRQYPCGRCGGTGQVFQQTGYDDFGTPLGYWVACPSCR